MTMLQHWNDLPGQGAGATVTKRSLEGAGASLVQVTIKAGTRADRHAHAHEQFVQVLSGSGMLETTEGRKPFSAGSLFHFSPGAWHEAVFDEDTVLVETNLQAP